MTILSKLWRAQYKQEPKAQPELEVVQEPVDQPEAGVSVNSATLEALTAVNGLGDAMAQAIIDGRPWTSLEDLTVVRGISKAALSRWTELTL